MSLPQQRSAKSSLHLLVDPLPSPGRVLCFLPLPVTISGIEREWGGAPVSLRRAGDGGRGLGWRAAPRSNGLGVA